MRDLIRCCAPRAAEHAALAAWSWVHALRAAEFAWVLAAAVLVGCYVDGNMGVSGTVTDAVTGAPVVDAQVCGFDRLDHEREFDRYRSSGDCGALPSLSCRETDAEGSYTLRVNLPGGGREQVWVVVCAEGYVNHEQVVAMDQVVETDFDSVAFIDVALPPAPL